MLHGGEGGEDGVVWLHHGGGGGGGGVHGEVQFWFPGILQAEPLLQEGREPGPGPSAEAVEDEEALRTGGILHLLPDPLQHPVQDLLSHGVVAPGEVVGGVLTAGDETVRVIQIFVGPAPELLRKMHMLLNIVKIIFPIEMLR